MKVVIDTNVFISCVGRKSPCRNIFDAFLSEKFGLCLSNQVLLEYEEKFGEKWGPAVADNLTTRLLLAPNTGWQDTYFQFNLVVNDADDNKFADLFLAAGADLLVSNDRALLRLNALPFPPVKVLSMAAFSALINRL